jgi:hypothetical protein
MTTIFARVETVLKAALPSLPVSLSSKLLATGTALPDEFCTYQLITAPGEDWADDKETARSYLVQVNYYNRAGLDGLPNIDGAMVTAGFSRGPRHQLPYDQMTRHFGLALDFNFYESE